MRAVVQRVAEATLGVETGDGAMREHAAIGPGLVALLGIEAADGQAELEWIAAKIPLLRIFPDSNGRMNLAVTDLPPAIGPGVLVVPNFTVAGRARKGRRPDFTMAKPPPEAAEMFKEAVSRIAAACPGVSVCSGVFGAHMHVRLVNDGPVTIWLDSEEGR